MRMTQCLPKRTGEHCRYIRTVAVKANDLSDTKKAVAYFPQVTCGY